MEASVGRGGGTLLMCGPQNRGQLKMHSAKISESLFQNVNIVSVIKNAFLVIAQNSWEAQRTFGNRVLNNHV